MTYVIPYPYGQPVRAILRSRQTGEYGVIISRSTNPDGTEWHWKQGNFSCDCSRADDFARALGRPLVDQKCSNSEYFLVSLTFSGRELVEPEE